MAGIHLPDIGKLGIHIATGLRDKKKVAPNNMAENARFQALSTRLDSEKHERGRVLKKEERRMKRRKHKIDRRRKDIQRNKKQEIDKDSRKSKSKKEKFLPLILYPNSSTSGKLNLDDETKTLHADSEQCSPSSAIFPIQEDFRMFSDDHDGRTSEKRKIFLPPLESGKNEVKNAKCGKLLCCKKAKRNSIAQRETNVLDSKHVKFGKTKRSLQSPPPKSSAEVETSFAARSHDEVSVMRWKEGGLPGEFSLESNSLDMDDFETQTKSSLDGSIESSNLSANPFNYLLVEAERRKALHQSLEDAFRAIKTCRYIRTPSRREGEDQTIEQPMT